MLDVNKFYKTFFSSDSSNVTTLDMQNSFNIYFTFEPSYGKAKGSKNGGSNVSKNAGELLLNISGGLLGTSKGEDLMKLRKSAKFDQSALNYITKGIMLGDGSGKLDMTMFVQGMVLPNMVVTGMEDITTMYGMYATSGFMVQPDQNEFNLEIVNTKLPILETVFYPWMREVTMPFWVYPERPYTVADITVNMSDHVDLKYVFYGCYPIFISTYDPSMTQPSLFTRSVRMKFLYMMILSTLKSKEKVKGKIKDVGNKLVSAVKGMI